MMSDLDLKALEALIVEYLAVLDDTLEHEQYETDRMYARQELTGFFEWLEKRKD